MQAALIGGLPLTLAVTFPSRPNGRCNGPSRARSRCPSPSGAPRPRRSAKIASPEPAMLTAAFLTTSPSASQLPLPAIDSSSSSAWPSMGHATAAGEAHLEAAALDPPASSSRPEPAIETLPSRASFSAAMRPDPAHRELARRRQGDAHEGVRVVPPLTPRRCSWREKSTSSPTRSPSTSTRKTLPSRSTTSGRAAAAKPFPALGPSGPARQAEPRRMRCRASAARSCRQGIRGSSNSSSRRIGESSCHRVLIR